jgi:hypothetical protein
MRTLPAKASVCFAFAATLLSITFTTTQARADDPAYAGTWASDLAQCKAGQDSQEAPLVLSADSYDQHETHCKFKSADGADNSWKVTSDCTIEGAAQPYDFTLTVSGDTLTVADDTGSRDLLKCK